jgi:hypothetical protein
MIDNQWVAETQTVPKVVQQVMMVQIILMKEGEPDVFDNTNNTKWLTFNPMGNLAYDFANQDAYAINKYTVVSANDALDRDPKNRDFHASK